MGTPVKQESPSRVWKPARRLTQGDQCADPKVSHAARGATASRWIIIGGPAADVTRVRGQIRYDWQLPWNAEQRPMDYDEDKIDEAVLALLGALEFENGRVWKRLDFDAMDRLHERGLITQPRGRTESVHLTEAGMQQAKELASKYFARRC